MPSKVVTPADRIPFWKKKWGTPRLLDDDAAEEAFEQFQEAFVPKHIRKQFNKLFWSAKPKFDNRFFVDEATFANWDKKLLDFAYADQGNAEAIVIYGSPDRIEAHALKGQLRRSLRDIFKDDWQHACAIVRTEKADLYLFIEPKMRGCVVRIIEKQQD